MRVRNPWIGGLSVALLLVSITGCGGQLRECEQERNLAQANLAQCQDDLAQCKRDVENCQPTPPPDGGHAPPPGPIIIITPNPNSGGKYVSVNGTACNDVSASGDTLNAKAFGALMQFEATVMEEGVPVTRTIRKAKLTLASGKVLEIIKTGDYPGVFTWKLDGAVLEPVSPAQDHDLRSDICSVAPVIEVEYQKLGGGTATTTAQSVTTRAYNF
jgi:hypothetical protein